MDCNFYINNEGKTFSPRDNRITGALTLTSKSDINDIHSITYGIKTKTQLISEYDERGSVVDPVLYEYYKYKSKNTKEFRSMLRNFDLAREAKEIYLTDNNLIHESEITQNSKLIKDSNGHWSFPKGETIALNFDLMFPSPDDWYLPSTADRSLDLKFPYNGSIQIRYYIYVKIQRESTILKKLKDKEFQKYIVYQSGNQFPVPITYLSYTNKKVFKNKSPKPELIDPKTGCYEVSGDIPMPQFRQPKFLKKLLFQKKDGFTIPVTTIFTLKSMMSVYEPLFNQFDLSFCFDFSQLDFQRNFRNSKRSTGLGLFQIESLKIYVLYSTCLTTEEETFRSDQPPQKFHEYKFNNLVFDMRDCIYDEKSKIGSMQISPNVFENQPNSSLALIEILKIPLLCSCDIFDTIRNFTTLQFVWTIVDSESKLQCTFQTDSTLCAELTTDSAPVYEEETDTPDYETMF